MIKVDLASTPRNTVSNIRRPPGTVTHAPYGREPYVRVRFPDGNMVDAKAAGWTRSYVLLHWMDSDNQAHNEWVPARAVRRITRAESRWQDPYDALGPAEDSKNVSVP